VTDEAWQYGEVKCGICRARSGQTVAPSLASDDAPDLDGRPSEPLRSALPFMLGRCPECGYVGAADGLWAPRGRARREAVRNLIESKAYRRLSRDAKLPIVARTFLCRSWIDEVVGDPSRAFLGALFAAWACDDEGLREAAGELRTRALEQWEIAESLGRAGHPDWSCGYSEAVRAEMLRRTDRFAESIEVAVAALALAGVPEGIRQALAYIADRSARGDREPHDLQDAFAHEGEEHDPRLVSYERGIAYRCALIAGAITALLPRERPPGQLEDAIIFDGDGYYVQILVRGEALQVYAEAVDLGAHAFPTELSGEQRDLLVALGWARPGTAHDSANYSREFEAGTPAELAEQVAGALELTLRLVYGAGASSGLGVNVITYDEAPAEA
jgi:hypothetical protein